MAFSTPFPTTPNVQSSGKFSTPFPVGDTPVTSGPPVQSFPQPQPKFQGAFNTDITPRNLNANDNPLPQTTQAVKDIVSGIKNPFLPKAGDVTAYSQRINSANIGQVMDAGWNSIKDSFVSEGKNIQDYFNAQMATGKNASPSKTLGAGLKVIAGAGGIVFSPITALFAGAEKSPVIAPIAKLVALPFQAIGEAGSGMASEIVNKLPISQQAKGQITPGLQEIFALAGQIAFGGKLDLISKTKELVTRFGEKDARTIIDTAQKLGEEKKAQINEPVQPHPLPEIPKITEPFPVEAPKSAPGEAIVPKVDSVPRKPLEFIKGTNKLTDAGEVSYLRGTFEKNPLTKSELDGYLSGNKKLLGELKQENVLKALNEADSITILDNSKPVEYGISGQTRGSYPTLFEGKFKDFNQSTSPLTQEALKYKSAEEFVKSPKYEYHLSSEPNLAEGKTFAEQSTEATSRNRGLMNGKEDGVFSTNSPQFWAQQLEYDLGKKAPQNVYLVEVKNSSPRGMLESGMDAQAMNAPQDIRVIKKLGTTADLQDIGRIEALKNTQLTDLYNKAQGESPLLQEVGKYKSAEEFVKAKGKDQSSYSLARKGIDTVYHETSPATAREIVFAQGDNRGLNVASNPDLALGQSGKGVKIEMDTSHLEGNVIRKPGTDFAGPQEFQLFNAPSRLTSYVKSVTLDQPLSPKGERAFFGLRDDWTATKEVLPDGKVKYTNPDYKSSSQLTDLYNQAKSGVSPVTPTEGNAVSGVAKSIEAKAIEQGLTTSGYAELAGYDSSTVKAQAELGAKYTIDEHIKFATGKEPYPEGMKPATSLSMAEDYAMKTKDGALALELANSKAATNISNAASTTSLSRMRTPDSATAKIKELQKLREQVAEKKLQDRTPDKVKAEIKKNLQDKTTKAKPNKYDLANLLDKIVC